MAVTATNEPTGGSSVRSRVVRALAWLLLAIAFGAFVVRGVVPAAEDSGDLAVGYAAARAWLAGDDPYDEARLDAILRGAGGQGIDQAGAPDELRNGYVPTTIPMFLTVAAPSWEIGLAIGLVINLVATVAVIAGVLRLLGWRAWTSRALLLAAFILAISPLRTTIASGQTGIVSTALVVWAVVAQRDDRGTRAGVLLGLATAVKFQIGLPFLLYYAWRRRWPAVGAGSIVILAATLVSIGRMAIAGVPWFASWMDNLRAMGAPGALDDPSPLDPERYSLVDLQVLLESIGIRGSLSQLLAVAVVGAAALATVWIIRGRQPRQELLALSVVAVLGLLVTYHRAYDAVILALPLAWAFWAYGTPRRTQAILVALLCATFILPLPTELFDLQQAGRLPGWLVDEPLWIPVVLSQQVWALVLMVPVLLVAAARAASADGATSDPGLAETVHAQPGRADRAQAPA